MLSPGILGMAGCSPLLCKQHDPLGPVSAGLFLERTNCGDECPLCPYRRRSRRSCYGRALRFRVPDQERQTTMKQFLLVAILALGAIAPAHSEMTIQDYCDKCIAGEKIQAVQQTCIAYAQGMFDGLAALQAMNKPVEVCIPTS